MHKLTAKIERMYCTWCAEQIKKRLLFLFKIKNIKANIKNQKITILSQHKIERNKFREEIERIGYGKVIFQNNKRG